MIRLIIKDEDSGKIILSSLVSISKRAINVVNNNAKYPNYTFDDAWDEFIDAAKHELSDWAPEYYDSDWSICSHEEEACFSRSSRA